MSTSNGSPRVHVLGLGSIGTFAAHSLAQIPQKPSVTLLIHRISLMNDYLRNGKNIYMKTREGKTVVCDDYECEVFHNKDWHTMDPELQLSTPNELAFLNGPTRNTIEHLIVSVKATQTVSALRPLLPRLAPHTNILFLQNGAGMIEDVNKYLFPDPGTRPNYIAGVISHGVTLNSAFDITHTGFAATSIGPVPRQQSSTTDSLNSKSPLSTSYLLKALPQVPQFNCHSLDWPDILQVQLEKLSCNAFCNPLCALADSPNKFLFTIPEKCRALMSEISAVVLALPELQGVAGVAERFSAEALEKTVMAIIDRTRETTCSMVWDLRAGRETEIDYINGYWVRRGRELGVPTPINDELIQSIQTRRT